MVWLLRFYSWVIGYCEGIQQAIGIDCHRTDCARTDCACTDYTRINSVMLYRQRIQLSNANSVLHFVKYVFWFEVGQLLDMVQQVK